MKFSNLLIQWYLQNKRDLWRNILIHTLFGSQKSCYNKQVAAKMPYFYLYKRFSTVFDLAKANEEQV
jgi:A/G-specific adenine glycosylase